MIWMNNNACYYTSKITTMHCRYIGLIYMNWLAQSPNVNPIENLWWIIKI